MNTSVPSPSVKMDSIAFTVQVEYKNYDCLISREALTDLCHSSNKEMDLLDAYKAHEATINGVARRLVAAGVDSAPLMLGTKFFSR